MELDRRTHLTTFRSPKFGRQIADFKIANICFVRLTYYFGRATMYFRTQKNASGSLPTTSGELLCTSERNKMLRESYQRLPNAYFVLPNAIKCFKFDVFTIINVMTSFGTKHNTQTEIVLKRIIWTLRQQKPEINTFDDRNTKQTTADNIGFM